MPVSIPFIKDQDPTLQLILYVLLGVLLGLLVLLCVAGVHRIFKCIKYYRLYVQEEETTWRRALGKTIRSMSQLSSQPSLLSNLQPQSPRTPMSSRGPRPTSSESQQDVADQSIVTIDDVKKTTFAKRVGAEDGSGDDGGGGGGGGQYHSNQTPASAGPATLAEAGPASPPTKKLSRRRSSIEKVQFAARHDKIALHRKRVSDSIDDPEAQKRQVLALAAIQNMYNNTSDDV